MKLLRDEIGVRFAGTFIHRLSLPTITSTQLCILPGSLDTSLAASGKGGNVTSAGSYSLGNTL